MANQNKQILLIDGSSFIFRAFYALPNLSSPSGVPTGAIYGVLNMLQQMQKRYSCAYWACVFDAKGKTFRDDLYPQYKATRREIPPELIPQFSIIHTLVAALGIPVIIHDGVEADDVIGSIATQHPDYDILIATGDKDFAQIVNDKIHLINTMTNEYLDYEGVIDKFNVKPEQIVDYLALIGDTVDNVPGVPKCGPKTAIKWLDKYQNLENIINNHHEITGVVGENLANSLQWLPMAKTLVTIKCDIPLNTLLINGLNDLEKKEKDVQILLQHFQDLGFKTWFKQLNETVNELNIFDSKNTNNIDNKNENNDKNNSLDDTNINNELINNNVNSSLNNVAPQTADIIAFNNTIITSVTQLKQIIATMSHIAILILHEEINNTSSKIATIIINNAQDNYIINFNQANDLLNLEPYNQEEYFIVLAELFGNKNITTTCINYKQLLYSLQHMNLLSIAGEITDITLAHYILNSQTKHDIANIYKTELNIETLNLENIYGIGAKAKKWSQLNLDEATNQAVNIVQNIRKLESQITQQLSAEELHIYKNIELPLTKVLFNMELAGIKIDKSGFAHLHMTLAQRLNQLEQQIYQETASVFNINSSKQLQDILFNRMQLPTTGLQKNTNGYSTNEETLSILAESGHSIATTLLEYRNLSKLLNTYIEKLPLVADYNDRIHTSLEQTVVASGRLSSKDPNLQNIPVRNDWGRQIRQCFIAANDYKFICADYSQIELRILAHISGDENLLNAFLQNEDIHQLTASEIFNKPLAEVTKDERRYAKSINFGLIYGKSVFGLAKELNITRDAAKMYIDAYFNKYPKVKQFMNNIKQQAHQDGFVSTVLGRRIYLPNINSNNRILSNAEERLALNAPMQGTSADIIKIAMNNIATWLEQEKLQTRLILQIHDELILEVPEREVEIISNNLKRLMTQNIIPLNVNLEVDVKIADNWDAAH